MDKQPEIKQDVRFSVSGNDLFMKIIWSSMAAICLYAATQLRTLSSNVSELNIKMATVVQAISNTDGVLRDHEPRIRKVEAIVIEHETRLKNMEKR